MKKIGKAYIKTNTAFLAYVAVGACSTALTAHLGMSNPEDLTQVAAGIALWPVNWILYGLSILFDEDE